MKFIVHSDHALELEQYMEMASKKLSTARGRGLDYTITKGDGITTVDIPEIALQRGGRAWIMRKSLQAQITAALLAKGIAARIEVKP